MRRALRWIFVGAILISLLLCAATCVVWRRSHQTRDYVWMLLPWPKDAAGRRWLKVSLNSSGGQLEVTSEVWTAVLREQIRRHNDLAGSDFYYREFPQVPQPYVRSIPRTAWNAVGFARYSGPGYSGVWLPYWSLVPLTACLPAAWAAAWMRRRRRVKAGGCRVCGYDLTGNVSGTCPECGTRVSAGTQIFYTVGNGDAACSRKP